MLHLRAKSQISGPNVANNIIFNSYLKEKYTFSFLEHNPQKGIKKNILVIPHLMSQIKEINPDIVHVTGLSRSGIESVLAARLCGKKVLLTIRGSSLDAINFKKKFLYAHIVEPLTLRLSHKVYTVCNAMANRTHIKKHSKHNFIGTIHNSAPIVDINKIETFDLRYKLNIDKNAVVVAIVGRMTFDKGVTYIVDAINVITDKNIVFVFIGDGGIIDEVQKKILPDDINKRVFFMGKQNQVMSILKECDIFLFATLHENLSNALLEACKVGLAVIATDVGGNPEVITDRHNGLLIPPRDSKAIVKSILQLVKNKEMRQKLGSNATKNVEENFSQSALLAKVGRVYQDLIDDKKCQLLV